LTIKEIKIKATLRFYLTLVRMVTVKSTYNNKYFYGCRRKEPSYTVGGNVS
jgi:hypothetical protein